MRFRHLDEDHVPLMGDSSEETTEEAHMALSDSSKFHVDDVIPVKSGKAAGRKFQRHKNNSLEHASFPFSVSLARSFLYIHPFVFSPSRCLSLSLFVF